MDYLADVAAWHDLVTTQDRILDYIYHYRLGSLGDTLHPLSRLQTAH